MSNTRYWIWFQSCVGLSKKATKIIEFFGNAKNVYDSNYLQRKACPDISAKLLDKMEATSIEQADKVIARCEQENWKIVTFEDEAYPQKLKKINNPPIVLYVCGELPDTNEHLSIGIVGTRKPSPYALAVSYAISKGIARCNGVVISGGALGIDSSAHEGALSENGKTVVVLGCGLGTNYLISNEDLRRRASNSGAIITEYPPDTPATKYTFPARNRIISGLSDGVFVAEASDKSGSLITASYALDQGRNLFATAASIFDERFNGTNKLIDDGAIAVTSLSAILTRYREKYNSLDMSKIATPNELLCERYSDNKIPQEDKEQFTFENIEQHRENKTEMDQTALMLSGNKKTVYLVLDDSYKDINSISKQASLEIKDVLTALTLLELDGLAQAGIGNRYRKKQS